MRNDQPVAKSWVMDGKTRPAEEAGVRGSKGSFLENHAAAGGRERLPRATCADEIRKSDDAGKFLFGGCRRLSKSGFNCLSKSGQFLEIFMAA